jgi:small subunit ribosomal protein S20
VRAHPTVPVQAVVDVPTVGCSRAEALTDLTEPYREISVANIKSQIKRNKTNEKARLRNKAVKSELKTFVRSFREAVAAGDKDQATSALRAAARRLDKAVSKGTIHKNQAANRKSAMAKVLNNL